LELTMTNQTSAGILGAATSLGLMMSASFADACRWSGDMVPITPPGNAEGLAHDATVATVSIAARHMAEPPSCRGAGDCDGILVVQIIRVIRGGARHGTSLREGEQILVPFGAPGCHYVAYPAGEFDVVLRRSVHPFRTAPNAPHDPKHYPKIDDEAHRSMSAYNIELRFIQPAELPKR
jgi:hypothetical protein